MVHDPSGAPGPTAALGPVRPGTVIEAPRRLSESSLWSVQRRYYERSGPAAWASGDVPHLLTSGPIIARSYATLIGAFAEDLAAGRAGGLREREPLYVVELGAGTGRLGFELARALSRASQDLRVVVVLTDAVEANLEFWLAHRRLAPLFEAGVLDVARYEAGSDARLELRHSGATLGPAPLANPLVLIANYFFDVLPQDLYASVDGTLVEERIALCAPDDALSPDAPGLFREVFLLPTPSTPGPRPDPEDDELLDRRAAAARGEERFLFPGLALETLRRFSTLAGGRLLTLIGERPGRRLGSAQDDPDVLSDSDEPEGRVRQVVDASGAVASTPGALLAMGIHGGSMSLPVDLGVLSSFASMHDGVLLQPVAEPTALVVAALCLGFTDAVSLHRRYGELVADEAPEDVYLTVKAATDREAHASLAMLLGAIRLGGYDPYLLRQCYPMLEEQLPDAPDELVDETGRVLVELEGHDYPLDDSEDVAFAIASLLAPRGRYELALECYRRSMQRRGPYPLALYNVALCHLHLEDVAAALAALDEAVALDPGYRAAADLRAMVIEERERRRGDSATIAH